MRIKCVFSVIGCQEGNEKIWVYKAAQLFLDFVHCTSAPIRLLLYMAYVQMKTMYVCAKILGLGNSSTETNYFFKLIRPHAQLILMVDDIIFLWLNWL